MTLDASPATLVTLAAVVALAFTIEATIGFGATVITVALGALFLPIDALLPVYIPVHIMLSASIVLRCRSMCAVDSKRSTGFFTNAGSPSQVLRSANARRSASAITCTLRTSP